MRDGCFLLAWKWLLFSETKSRAIERPLAGGTPPFPAQTQVPLRLLRSLPQATSSPPPAPLPPASCPGWAERGKQQDSAVLPRRISVLVSRLAHGVVLIIYGLCRSAVRNRLAPSPLRGLQDSSIFWSRSHRKAAPPGPASYRGKATTLLDQQHQFSLLQI